MKKVLIVVTNHDKLGNTGKKTGLSLHEVTNVYYPLVEAGFQVDFASPKGGLAPLDGDTAHNSDPLSKKFLEDKNTFSRLERTVALKDINPKDYKAIAFAGGHGTMWDFPDSPDVNRVTSQIYDGGGIVAALCHGPAALVNVKLANGKYLVEGKDMNSFTDSEEEAVGLSSVVPFLLETKLRKRGAKFQAGKNFENKVVVSERLVTGQNLQSAHALGKKLAELAKKS